MPEKPFDLGGVDLVEGWDAAVVQRQGGRQIVSGHFSNVHHVERYSTAAIA